MDEPLIIHLQDEIDSNTRLRSEKSREEYNPCIDGRIHPLGMQTGLSFNY